MRIAHVITRMIIGGAQENTLLCCQDLIREYGDEVLLITGPALGPEGDLLSAGRGDDIPCHMIPSLRRALHPWQDWQSYLELKRILLKYAPQVVHTHSAKGGFLGRVSAAALRIPAIIHTVHGAPFHEYQGAAARQLFRICEQHAAAKCHRLISVADAMTDRLVAAGVAPREKFVTVYSGMDVEPFLQADRWRADTRSRLGFAEDDVVFGKIARLFHLKGHVDLIEAAHRVADTCPRARFLCVGDGILKQQLQQRISRYDLDSRFVFTGLVPPEDIPALLAAMDVLVHCSLREGLARALPQALIAGKPVISYDIDGAREVVISDQTGFLVPPNDLEMLTAAMRSLYRQPEQRERFGAAGRARFTEPFRHQTMTARLRQIYVDVLSEKS